MGDRCQLTIILRKRDEEKLLAAMLASGYIRYTNRLTDVCDEYEEPEDKTISLTIYEANYALYQERRQWAETANFIGSHSAGGSYNATRFVAWDGKLIEVNDGSDGHILCPVHKRTGVPIPEELKKIQEYIAAYNAFREAQKEDA